MGAWTYCSNCGEGMDEPTRHQVLRGDYCCSHCGADNDPVITPLELICDELDRLEQAAGGGESQYEAPTAQEVKALREQTGKGMAECQAMLTRQRLDKAIKTMNADATLKQVLSVLVSKQFPSGGDDSLAGIASSL